MQDSDDVDQPLLLHLPIELLNYILLFVDVRDVYYVVRVLCRSLYAALSNETYWRKRLFAQYGRCCINVPTVNIPPYMFAQAAFSWSRSCVAIEAERNRWRSSRRMNRSLPDHIFTVGHIASVNTLHICNNAQFREKPLLLSGSRDYSLCIWDINDARHCDPMKKNAPLHMKNAHKGWIWTIDVDKAGSTSKCLRFASGGFDGFLNVWQFDGTEMKLTATANRDLPLLRCIYPDKSNPNIILVSYHDGLISTYDLRTADRRMTPVNSSNHHSKVVHSLCVNNDDGIVSPYYYSASEDRRVCCVDRRMNRLLTERTFPQAVTSMCYASNMLTVGTRRGFVSLIEPHTAGLPSIANLKVCDRVNSVAHHRGIVFASGSDRNIYIRRLLLARHPAMPPLGEFPYEPTAITYTNGELAAGFTDGTIGFWTDDKNRYNDSLSELWL